MLFDDTDDEREIRKKEFIRNLKISKCGELINPLRKKLDLFQDGRADPEEVFNTAGFVAGEGKKLIGDFRKKPDVILAGIAMEKNVYMSSIGKIDVSVRVGEITDFFSDAIINPASSDGTMSEGPGAVIKNKGGNDIEKEATSKSPITIEKPISTTSGNLTCRHIIHAVLPEDSAGYHSDESIKSAFSKVLKLADKLDSATVTIPVIWNNLEETNNHRAVIALLEAIKSQKTESINRIILVAGADDQANAVAGILTGYDEEV